MADKEIQFLLYQAEEEKVSIQAVVKDENIWLTQKAMAELFGCSKSNISVHLRNVYDEGELLTESTVEEISTVATEGQRSVTRKQTFYNLDAIISVGYRVNSKRATQFRIWATKVLKEYMLKGFVLDDDRLKQGKTAFGKDYFRELLERVRSIRASERRIYRKTTLHLLWCSVVFIFRRSAKSLSRSARCSAVFPAARRSRGIRKLRGWLWRLAGEGAGRGRPG